MKRYGRDFYVNGAIASNYSGIDLNKANYIVVVGQNRIINKAYCFKSEKSAIRFFKSGFGYRCYSRYTDGWYRVEPSDYLDKFAFFGCEPQDIHE